MLRNAFRTAFAWGTQSKTHFFSLVAGLAMLGWAVVWLCLGALPLAELLFGGAFSMAACLALWARGARGLVLHLTIAGVIGVVVGLVALSGGITGNMALWLYLLPIGIALLLGVRASLYWNGVVGLAVFLLAAARFAGVELPDLIPASHAVALELASNVSAVLVILLLSMFYAWSQENALRRTRVSHESLSASEARFRELTEAIARMDGHAVVVTDLQGVITFAAGTGTTHGLPPESIVGQPVRVLGKNAPDADRTTAAFTHASLAERPWTQAVEATHANGQNFPILLSCSPYYAAKGEIVGTVTIGRDLTQERWNQERLLQSAKLASIGELVAGVAHELNNPLTIIKSTAYLLGDEVGEEAAEEVRMIAEAAERAVRIVRGLLHFSRQTPARRAATQLAEVVERVMRFREDALRANGVAVVRELAPRLPEVCADSAQLEQVLLNLLNNAEQAMREAGSNGCVTIRTEHRGATLRFSVADTGPGIAPEVLPRIFDPFFTTRRVGEGTGLGLALSHGIISEHGGAIWAESPPGAGAVFHVELPVPEWDAHLPAAPAGDDVEERRTTAPRRVLVVDDEPAIRSSVSRYLARRGHRVDEAASGQEALQRVSGAAYDAILLDLKMVGMSGHEVYAALCEHWPELAGRVRFATGDVVSPETLAFLEATGRPYFEKPYSLAEVAADVEDEPEGAR